MFSLESRAVRGARWLDKKSPAWFLAVDKGRLDPHSVTNCVMGQVEGDFDKWADEKFWVFPAQDRLIQEHEWACFLMPNTLYGLVWITMHGFVLLPGDRGDHWLDAWREEIDDRRSRHQIEQFRDELLLQFN